MTRNIARTEYIEINRERALFMGYMVAWRLLFREMIDLRGISVKAKARKHGEEYIVAHQGICERIVMVLNRDAQIAA